MVPRPKYPKGHVRLPNGYIGYGPVVQPDDQRRCGRCGCSGFSYRNGHQWSVCGTRGYRCLQCDAIKPEPPLEMNNA